MQMCAACRAGIEHGCPAIACTGRPVDRDPLQSSEGWQKFTGGWLVGGLSGVAWGYILTQILPYCELDFLFVHLHCWLQCDFLLSASALLTGGRPSEVQNAMPWDRALLTRTDFTDMSPAISCRLLKKEQRRRGAEVLVGGWMTAAASVASLLF